MFAFGSVSDADRSWFQTLLRDVVNKHMGIKFDKVFDAPVNGETAGGDLAALRSVLFCDFMTQVSD